MAEKEGKRKFGDSTQGIPKSKSTSSKAAGKKKQKESKGHHESKLEKLKYVVIRILKKQPEGVLKSNIWNLVLKETGLQVSAKDYGLSKMNHAFEKWSDVIGVKGAPKAEILFLICEQEMPLREGQSGVGNEKLITKETETDTGNVEFLNQRVDSLTDTSQITDNSKRLYIEVDQRNYEKETKQTLSQGIFQQSLMQQRKCDTDARLENQRKNVHFDFEVDSEAFAEDSDNISEGEEAEIKSVIDSLLEDSKETGQDKLQGQKSNQSWMHIAVNSSISESKTEMKPRGEQCLSALPEHQRIEQADIKEQVMSAPYQGQSNQSSFGAPPGILTEAIQHPLMNIPLPQPQPHGIPAQNRMMPPGLGNMAIAPQDMNRFFMPAIGLNQSGLFLPNQAGMPLLGMPFSFRMPVASVGQFRAPSAPQQMGHPANPISQVTVPTTETKDVKRLVVDTTVDETAETQNTNTPHISSPNILSLKGTSSVSSLEETLSPVTMSECAAGRSQGASIAVSKEEDICDATRSGTHKVEVDETTGTSSINNNCNNVQAQVSSERRKPFPAWTSQQDPRQIQVQMQPYGTHHVEKPLQLVHMPALSQQNTNVSQTLLQPAFIRSGIQTEGQKEPIKAIPSWTQIAKQRPDIGQVRVPSPMTLNFGQEMKPSFATNQTVVSMPVPEQNRNRTPPVDWSKYDKQTLSGTPVYEGNRFQDQSKLAFGNTVRQPVMNTLEKSGLEKWQPFSEDIVNLTAKPINKEEFPKTLKFDFRPVYVPLGKLPPKEQIDSVAKESIEMLADANELVTPERVEQLVKKRFGCESIQNLGISHIDKIPCIYELNRLICKINAFVTAFLKTRAICTLYELKEALRDFVPDKGDFSLLKTGPLQRFPVVFQQFRFPPDLAEIPEITTMDILDHFNNYLTNNRLWTGTKLELEPFINYLVQEYNADNAYMLGVRIRSLPLAIMVLKKAKRDSVSCHRAVREHFEENLKTEIGDAFRKFRINILHTGEGEGMEVRKHYLKMKPELTIMEIVDKFNVLLMITQDRFMRPLRLRRVIEDFLNVMKEDELGRNILHLAICMSNTAVEETVKQTFAQDIDSEDADAEKEKRHKPPPRKSALIESLKTYLERCLNAGAISLMHLDRIEEKMLEDFGYSAFSMMGYGRFLEFLLKEAKQTLEESGGLQLGSSSGGTESDSTFKPHHTDLIEFIKQCKQQENIQPEEIEEAVCTHYSVKDVRHLGHGNMTRLLGYTEKHGRLIVDNFTVLYEPALLRCSRFSQGSFSKVGVLGHQTRDAAKICLHNCPLLENMADWSKWGLVFEPEHGKLKDFMQKYGGVSTKSLEGGRVVTLDFLALEIKPGELVKIVSSTSQEHVAKAIEERNVLSTTGHLVSMAVAFKGVENMPLALLSRLVTTELIKMHASEPAGENMGYTLTRHPAIEFVLQCLLRIPVKICVSLANQLFLEPLGRVVGSSKSKQLLVQQCKTEAELSHLLELGCLLGVQEWTDVIQRNCQLQDSAVQTLPSEVQEFFEIDELNQEGDDIEMNEDSDIEDVDQILEGESTGDTDNSEAAMSYSELTEDVKKELSETEETDEEIDTTISVGSAKKEITSCEEIVNQIRRDEFGVGVQLSEDGQRLMKVQQERLGRSLDRLSRDLYSKDTHFVLELVQNADDNSYPDNLLNDSSDECPSVKFVIEHDGIHVYNNELGFREKDIRALCDVGRSTKGKHKFGYIGQKGIGFKSVFRITDSPEVHSNGYHIKFDVGSGPMGYILPHWIPEEGRVNQNNWMTQITLKLKADMRLQTRTLAARFNDIHPSLLLFLHRLREITIENKVENTVETMRRRDIGGNVVEITHTHGCDRWLVIKKMLDASKISLQTKSGAEVESTELAIAFPLKQHGKKTRMPPKQPVFAFLPLRSYGFRFIVQGDFDVPSSREDVDRDSSWNQWLRNEIHTVFIDALDTFKTHPDFSSMEAVCTFLQFVPMEDEVLDFFKPVASDILKKLKAKQCVPTQPDSEGIVSWKIPSQAVRVRDPLVRSVITPDLLQTHLNLFYLHTDVAAMLNPTLTSCLGIETLTSDHLFQLGKALIMKIGTHCSKHEDVVLISKWMACLYRSLDEFHNDDTILETFRTQRMLPLSDGELVSLQDKTIFFPIVNSSLNKQKGKDPLYHLQRDIRSIHPLLLHTGDDEVNSQVHKLLMRLGIKQLSPFDLINHHIIPVLKSDDWKSKSQGTLISYLVYIKDQVEKQASVCNIEEVKDIVMVKTNKGFKNPSREPVHFPPEYGNRICLQDVFSGYDWTLLDTCYLPSPCSPPMVIAWQDFLRKLGVEEFLSLRKKDVLITRDELEQSLWCNESVLWPKEEQEFTVQDYYSAELEGLLTKNHFSGDTFASQMSNLFAYLDRHWDGRFSKYCKCHVLGKDGKILKETVSSFSILLRTSSWLPAVQTTTQNINGYLKRDICIVMKQPSDLYMKSDIIKSLLYDKVLYLHANSAGRSFCEFLGIRNSIEIQTLKDLLSKWSERKEVDTPAEFCTTLEHMKNVYRYLGSQLTRQDFCSLLQEKPVYFVPDRFQINKMIGVEQPVPGRMLNRNEIWMVDKTGLFAKHRSLLEEFHSEICNKRTIAEFYRDSPDIIELFRQEGKLDMHPKIDEYIKLLCLLCNTSSPKDGNILSDVLYIFSTIGEILITTSEGMPGEQSANIALEALKTFVKRKLTRQKVFPTSKQIWVSLEDRPMIPDNREWEKMFCDKEGVHFLDMEDKMARITRKARGSSLVRANTNKVIESHVKPDMINIVIEVCGIKRLSEAVDVRPTPEMISPCLQLQDYFSQVTPALQQYLVAKFEDTYQSLEPLKMKEILRDAKFYQAGKLEVSYWIPDMSVDTFVIQQEKCVIHPPEFYFHRDHLTALGEVASKEVARYFSKGNTDCNNLLRSFLTDMFCIISGVNEDTIEGLLQRHEADDVEILEEEQWVVKAPVLPEPDKPKDPEPEDNVPENATASEVTAQKDGPFEIRMWPPVANSDRSQSRGTSDIPVSNIWPPPAAKDYMRSLKELPSDINIVIAGVSSEESIPEQPVSVETGVSAGQVFMPGQGVSGNDFFFNTQSEMKAKSLTAAACVTNNAKFDHENRETMNREVRSNSTEVQSMYMTQQAPSTDSNIQDLGRHQKDNSTKFLATEEHPRSEVFPPSANERNTSFRNEKDIHHSGSVTQMKTSDQQLRDRKPVITGVPFWSDMATEYTYDELGSGKDFSAVIGIVLEEEADNREIGRWGEELVANYLRRQKDLGNIKDFLWRNSEEESRCPYDFEIELMGDNDLQKNYIEVKSTVSDSKEAFEISLQQVKFANKMKENFHIYRVFNAGNPERVKLIRIKNVDMRLSTKQVKLCIVI